jgi:hypothetical protein
MALALPCKFEQPKCNKTTDVDLKNVSYSDEFSGDKDEFIYIEI